MKPDQGQGQRACDQVGEDNGGGVEVPFYAGGGSGEAGTGSVEEFTTETAFEGGILDVFGTVGAFFHFICAFCLLFRLFMALILRKIVINHGEGGGFPIMVVDK